MNSKMKKTAATVCLGAAVLALTPAVSMAETSMKPVNAQTENAISPYMLYIRQTTSVLSISGTTATVDCSTLGVVGEATNAKTVAELQVQNGSSWTTVETWADTQNGYRASVYENYSVTKEKTYRVKATATAWEGSQSEIQTVFSNEKTA